MYTIECRPLREIFFFYLKKKIPTAIKLEGEGLKALMVRPLRKRTFFAASLCITVVDLRFGGGRPHLREGVPVNDVLVRPEQ